MKRISRICIKSAAHFFEKALFRLLYAVKWKQKTVQANLDYTQINRITDKELFYRQLIKNLAHHIREIVFEFDLFKKLPHKLNRYPIQLFSTNYVIAPQSEVVLDKMRNGGIFLTAHYGNYEAMGPWLCRLGIPLKASYVPLKPAWLNRIVENKIRSVNKKPYSVNARTPREFLELLDKKNLFCLLMDQDSRIASATSAKFLGCDVHTNPLPKFLLKHRPETPGFICWIEETRKSKILHANEVAQKTEIEKTYNRWLEERIRENPTFWYGWTHRRFYSTAPELYRK